MYIVITYISDVESDSRGSICKSEFRKGEYFCCISRFLQFTERVQ
jgi:hypothetical protein